MSERKRGGETEESEGEGEGEIEFNKEGFESA